MVFGDVLRRAIGTVKHNVEINRRPTVLDKSAGAAASG